MNKKKKKYAHLENEHLQLREELNSNEINSSAKIKQLKKERKDLKETIERYELLKKEKYQKETELDFYVHKSEKYKRKYNNLKGTFASEIKVSKNQ